MPTAPAPTAGGTWRRDRTLRVCGIEARRHADRLEPTLAARTGLVSVTGTCAELDAVAARRPAARGDVDVMTAAVDLPTDQPVRGSFRVPPEATVMIAAASQRHTSGDVPAFGPGADWTVARGGHGCVRVRGQRKCPD